MARRNDEEMEDVTEAIELAAMREVRSSVLTVSANELADEFGVSPNTVIKILKGLGFKNDGYYWYLDS